MSAHLAIGVDLGGTNIATGIVDENGRIIARDKRPTLSKLGSEGVADRMGESVKACLEGAKLTPQDVIGIGIGSPGPLSVKRGVVIHTNNLQWENVPIARMIQERTSIAACLENDANAAAYGEAWVGAGRDAGIMVMYTLGTGIGGGIVSDGKIIHGRDDYAAELGHVPIEPVGRACSCGGTGCIEAYASAPSTVKRFEEAVASGEKTAVPTGKITTADLHHWACKGDALAIRILNETGFYLAITIVGMLHILNPDVVILTGGMIAAGDYIMEPLRRTVRERAMDGFGDTPIIFAELGDDAGIIGAAGCAFKQFATSQS